MKYTANIISIIRLILSFVLFFEFKHPYIFLILYLICGISDVLDGFIARKTNTQSELGARLDSIADLILFTLITVDVILWMGNEIFKFLPLIILIVFIRIVNVVIAASKYHALAMLHTWGNKITGFFAFIVPLLILFHQNVLLWIVCIIAVLSAVEETMIHISSSKLDLNRQSIFKN